MISTAQIVELEHSFSVKRKWLKAFVMCCMLPITLNYFAYYGFVTNYTYGLFTSAGFHGQYDNGIYKYRVLGKKLLLLIYGVEQHRHHFGNGESRMAQFLETDNLSLYHSYFLLNTTFLCLTIWTLYLTFQSGLFRMREQEKYLALMAATFLIVMTQFVVVPYDTPAYFFLALTIYLMLQRPSAMTTVGLIVAIVLSALTRETAALTLSMYTTLYLLRKQINVELTLPVLAALAVAFVGTYVALRLHFGWHQGIGASITLGSNLHRLGLIGLAFLVSVVFLLTDISNAISKKAVMLFLAFSSPYLLSILLTGVLFEARLGVPLFIGVIVLTNLTGRIEPKLTSTGSPV